jgi:hypothetical protein
LESPRELAALLRGTVLEGLPVEDGLGGTILVNGVDPARVLESWRDAHALMPLTGRWPVFTGVGMLYHEPEPAEITLLDRAARRMNPWSVFTPRHVDRELLDRDEVQRYVDAFLGRDHAARALGQLTVPVADVVVQRWVYDTILADAGLYTRKADHDGCLGGRRQWWGPDEVQLVLLPTTSQWLAPAWVSYFGAACEGGYPAWAAIMRRWQLRWDAALVTAWGTSLHFLAGRRPDPGPLAWELAGELLALGRSLDEQQWQLAIAVAHDDIWFLHDRP